MHGSSTNESQSGALSAEETPRGQSCTSFHTEPIPLSVHVQLKPESPEYYPDKDNKESPSQSIRGGSVRTPFFVATVF